MGQKVSSKTMIKEDARDQLLQYIRAISVLILGLLVCGLIYSAWAGKNIQPYMLEILELNGFGNLVPLPEIVFVLVPYIEIIVVGLVLLRAPYSDLFFLILLVCTQLLYAVSGLAVVQPFNATLGSILYLAYGGLLFAIFLHWRVVRS